MAIRPALALRPLHYFPFILIAGLPAFAALLMLPPQERIFVGLAQTLFALVPATLFFIFGDLAVRPSSTTHRPHPRLRASILLVLGWAIFSVFYVAQVPLWALFWTQFVVWGVLAACIMRAAVERHGVDLVLLFLRALLWSGPLYGAVLVLYYQLYGDVIPQEYTSLLPAFGNVRRAGHLLTLSATAGAMLVALRLGGRWTVALTLLAATIAFWAGARGTIVVLVTALPFTLLVSGQLQIRTLMRLMAALLIAAALSLLIPTPNTNFGLVNMLASLPGLESILTGAASTPSLDTLSSNRMGMWQDAVANIQLRPLTGWGYAHAPFAAYEAPMLHLHNWPLELLLAWGLPMGGLACLLVLVYWFKAQRRMGIEQAAALGVLNVATAYSLISGTYFYGVPVILMSIAWGVTLARLPGAGPDRHTYMR
ncbi:O-antigen ligase family protein [Pontivivens ytuae]|uniref:O-antigen ligase family protein n=2 Tax=Pontivivens ytuae TaxID=2789856 RepID=A0A7S9LNS9_9RHOB|nr:O-antigen ligase family protein [Pontivivens ytuae]